MVAIIKKTLDILKQGKVILYPTDTIWGIGCDATNNSAVERLNAIKRRRKGQPLILLVDSISMLREYVKELPEFVVDFLKMSKFPVTVIYPNPKQLPSIVLADDGSVGIRVVDVVPFTTALIRELGVPLTSTSANISGQPTPLSYKEIDPAFIEKIDYVVPSKHGWNSKASPSKIFKIQGSRMIQLR